MRTSITTLSEWTGISRDTIRKRIGAILTGQHGEQVDSAKALPLIYGDGERLDPGQEKAKLDKVKRGLASLEFKLKQRELITVEDACKIIDIAATSCREHLMGIPGRWADILAAETDARAVEEILEREIRAGLQNVADARDRFQR
jgi:hypothetical protein